MYKRIQSTHALTQKSINKYKILSPLLRAWKGSDHYKTDNYFELIDKIKNNDESLRAAVSELVGALRDKSSTLRWAAGVVLSRLGPAAEGSVPALIEALKDEWPDIRAQAAHALGQIGGAPQDAIPAIIGLMQDEVVFVREECALALGKFHASAEMAIPALINAIRDEEEAVSMMAAYSLGRIAANIRASTYFKPPPSSTQEKSLRDATAFVLGIIEEVEREQGIEVMGYRAAMMKGRFEHFRHIGEYCKKRDVDSFKISVLANLIDSGETKAGYILDEISCFFREYFKITKGIEIPTDDDESTDGRNKIFDRGQGKRGVTIRELGWRSWELACQFLDRQAKRDSALKPTGRQNVDNRS